ncbi:arylamine N-acetyltransferase [Caballeronia sordidicola]|uniref:arylamine N-acetyltransferase n=1 Tax=Caballeronia sordidicola TaxID=196367 RepID=UPI0004D02A26|nr:arylamine N-acetyltransferase [Caballeronia sordidicola]
MLVDNFDLDAYHHRIGYAGPPEPTLPVLRSVVAGHATTIAFENIDVFRERGVRIDVVSLQDKLVLRGRGGYRH